MPLWHILYDSHRLAIQTVRHPTQHFYIAYRTIRCHYKSTEHTPLNTATIRLRRIASLLIDKSLKSHFASRKFRTFIDSFAEVSLHFHRHVTSHRRLIQYHPARLRIDRLRSQCKKYAG